MARKGRQFELLIKKLEEMKLPEGTEVHSPGWLVDKVTGSKREVDILIQSKIGTSDINIVIECRDRSSVEDATWIEQLSTKTQHIEAHRVIAVSSNGFGKPAIRKAKLLKIEPRTYGEIDKERVENWWKPDTMGLIKNGFAIRHVEIIVDNPENFEEVLNSKKVGDKFINQIGKTELFSVNDVVGGALDKMDIWKEVYEKSEPIKKSVSISYTNPLDRFEIQEGKFKSAITSINVEVELKILTSQVPISRIEEYKSQDRTIAQVLEFDEFPLPGNQVLQFIRNEDGSLSISARKRLED